MYNTAVKCGHMTLLSCVHSLNLNHLLCITKVSLFIMHGGARE